MTEVSVHYDGTNFVIDTEDFATTANKGIVELATDAETASKASTSLAITASNLAVIAPNNQKFQAYTSATIPTSFSVAH